MKKLTATIFLTVAVLLGSVGVSWSDDLKKGLTAAQNGDFATALREWKSLAEQGFAYAQFNLGLMYDDGRGVPEDDGEAVKWYRLAAEQGHASAQNNLGLMYQKGQGVPKDYKTAVKWYKLAAEQGFPAAQGNLGVMHGKGQGVPQDYKIAVKWYKLAAEQGVADAQGNLGVMYAFGTGILKDYVYAHMWGNIAATNGHELGAKLRDDFEKNMTASQIVEAQKIAQKCIQKKYKGCLKTSSKSNILAKIIPLKSVAEIENERLRREISHLRQQNELKSRHGSKRQSEKGFPSTSSGFTEKNTKYYDTKLLGLVTSLEDHGFLLNVGYGKFHIKYNGESYKPMRGDDITVIGNTNEFYAKSALVFADKIILHSRRSKSGSLIQRNIEDGWVSINGRILSVFNNIIHINTDEKMAVSLKYVKFIPSLDIGSLVSVNGYLTKDDTGEFFVKAKNIIKLSNK